jgi:hypothetical protein
MIGEIYTWGKRNSSSFSRIPINGMMEEERILLGKHIITGKNGCKS